MRTTIILGAVLVLAFGCSSAVEPRTDSPKILAEKQHEHYHIHGMQVSHEHDHEEGTSVRHAHHHEHDRH